MLVTAFSGLPSHFVPPSLPGRCVQTAEKAGRLGLRRDVCQANGPGQVKQGWAVGRVGAGKEFDPAESWKCYLEPFFYS